MAGHLAPSDKRAEIEGLRAVAVALVVLYHLRVEPFGGGYVGVDTFFVLSGFLITGLLVREKTSSGTVRLGEFWARRLRRIMPMALLVVVVTVLLGYQYLEPQRTDELMPVALGAVGFCANIVLFYRTTDYLGGVTLPSPLQHYWSLGVEEQFYLVWPLVVWVVARLGRRHWKRWLALVCAAALVGSLLESIRVSGRDHGAGYFLPQTRVWEILLGAALALGATRLNRLPRVLSGLAGWGGLAAIGYAAVTFDEQTTFPGHLALVPVLGAAAVILAADSPWGPHRVLRIAPLQYIGLWSFSIYLLHFPLIVLAEAQVGELAALSKVAVAAACVVLAAITYHVVERPIRWNGWLSLRPRRTIVAGFAALSLLLAAGTTVQAVRTPASDENPGFAVPSGLDEAGGSILMPGPGDSGGGRDRDAGPPGGDTFSTVPDTTGGTSGEPDATGTTGAGSTTTTTIPATTSLNVLLLGDSTLAGLRWYEQAHLSLAGFQYVLDAEACRRLAYKGCEGREGRTPMSAAGVVKRLAVHYDVIVVQAGYHGATAAFDDELRDLVAAVNATGSRLMLLTLKESLRFPVQGSNGQRSIYTGFNEIISRMQASGELGNAIVADWNLFSYTHPEWFRPDGIHTTITGALGLGWFISTSLAAAYGNPCPYDGEYPCVVPPVADPAFDTLAMFGVAYTDMQCYEDGRQRKRVCEADRRMT